MSNSKKLSILTQVLGSYSKVGSEHLFHCPYCEHHKKKMSINLDKGWFKCWVCDTRGKNIFRIVKRYGNHNHKSDWLALTSEVDYGKLEDLFAEKVEQKQVVELPKGFISLARKEVPTTGFAPRNYLRKRGLSKEDIIWWKMGYCSEGEYAGRVIIPSFDEEGDLNYFVSRSFSKDIWPKYKNPKAGRNIVFNDLFVDWTSDIILVEGVFDAMAIRMNAIPLFGKSPQSELQKRIIEKNVRKVYIALDSDAFKNALSFAEKLMNTGVDVHLVEMGDSDPSELGFDKIYDKIKNTELLSLRKLMEYKLLGV